MASTRSRPPIRSRALPALAIAASAAAAQPVDPSIVAVWPSDAVIRSILDSSMRAELGALIAIDSNGVRFLDDIGRPRTVGWERLLAITTPEGIESFRPALDPDVRVDLNDGRRWIGTLARESADEVIVDLAWGGRVRASLEEVASIERLEGGADVVPPSAPSGGDDVLEMSNGDRLRGFLVAFGPRVEFETDSGVVEVGRERVVSVRLAAEPAEPLGPRVWLSDGSVVNASPAGAAPGTGAPDGLGFLWSLGAAGSGGQPVSWELDAVEAYTPEVSSLTALATIRLDGFTLPSERRWSEPPEVDDPRAVPIGLADIRVPGPMSLRWTLPSASVRLVLQVEADPAVVGPWTDSVVTAAIETVDGMLEVGSVRVTSGDPGQTIDASLPGDGGPGRVLVVTIDSGEYGPVQDAVILRRGALLNTN